MKASEYIKAYIALLRLDKPVGIWLLLFPTLTALYIATIESGIQVQLSTLFIFTFGSIAMRSAGCAINDYFDRNFDGEVSRTKNRPLVLYPHLAKHALYLALIFAVLSGLLVILFFNVKTILLALLALIIAATYPLFKRFFSLPQAYLGLAFSMGIPMVYTAQNFAVSWVTYALLLANILIVFAYDTAYAMVDKPYDIKLGIKTSAIFLGKYTQICIIICTLLYWFMQAYIAYFYANLLLSAFLLAFGLLKIVKYDYRHLYSSNSKDYFSVFTSNQYALIFTFLGWFIYYLFI